MIAASFYPQIIISFIIHVFIHLSIFGYKENRNYIKQLLFYRNKRNIFSKISLAFLIGCVKLFYFIYLIIFFIYLIFLNIIPTIFITLPHYSKKIEVPLLTLYFNIYLFSNIDCSLSMQLTIFDFSLTSSFPILIMLVHQNIIQIIIEITKTIQVDSFNLS